VESWFLVFDYNDEIITRYFAIYLGGLIVLDISDYFGGGWRFIIFLMATIETIGICWIYGLNRFVCEIESMLGIKLNTYWKIHHHWAYMITAVLIFIFCSAMAY
jgi:solute carrier family 6 amino acid transporter-like protein 5/7/9/14